MSESSQDHRSAATYANAGSALATRCRALRGEWKSRQGYWRIAHYTLGIVGLLASLAATLILNQKTPPFEWYYSTAIGALAGGCTVLITFLGAQKRADRFSLAYNIADQALTEFDDGLLTREQLAREIKRARQMVSSVSSHVDEGGPMVPHRAGPKPPKV